MDTAAESFSAARADDSGPGAHAGDGPVFIVLNAGSGQTDKDEICAIIEAALTAAGREHEIMRVDDASRFPAIARAAAAQARKQGGIVVAAGGDGTLNTVAQAALDSGCPFGVIPQGTFNYFGRTHGIPADAEQATRALLTARVQPVRVGLVNDRIFLVNASLGLYPRVLDEREEQKERFGRSRIVAAWAALVAVLRGYRPVRMKLEHGGRTREVRVLTLFVGNNRLQLEQLGLQQTGGARVGELVAILLRPVATLPLLWLMARGAVGKLADARGVEHFPVDALTIMPSDARVNRVKIATDGETDWMPTPIRFRVAPQPLLLLLPVDSFPEAAA